MHKLGDQWIEIIDGQEHMVKAVNSTYNCNGCAYLCHNGKCSHESILECPVYRIDAIIKDLGILKDGLLPTPWDEKQYPQQEIYRGEWSYYAKGSGVTMRATGKTKQQAIDAWNRRS